MVIETLLLSFCIPAGALDHPTPPPLPASPKAEDGRVMVDSDSDRDASPEAPPPGSPGVKRHGLGRLVSVDPKGRRVVIEHEDGVEEAYQVPEGARLTFASDERPLNLDQLRRGDAVSYLVEGPKAARLHLDLCGDAEDPGDAYSKPRRSRRNRRPPPPPDEEEPQFPVDEPDRPMYQSETEPAPKAEPAKK